MTGGRVVVLGRTGRNFAAGMSGGVAYVLDEHGDFATRCNKEMVYLEKLDDPAEIDEVKAMIERHVEYTGSDLGRRVLANWANNLPKFVKVMPKDYKRIFAPADTFAGAALWTIAWINLAAGYLMSILVGALSALRRGQPRLALSALLMPLCWLLVSAAAYRALYQLAKDPYFWEKTEHGARPASPARGRS